MTRPTADCEVWLDGAPAAQTVDRLKAGVPTILDGLSMHWGRANQLDQPDIGTCTFVIRDEAASSDALDIARVGTDVAVYSTGTVPVPEDQVIFNDGGFELSRPGALPSSRFLAKQGSPTLTVVKGTQSHTGQQALRITASLTSAVRQVLFPPLPFSPVGGDPTAWDSIPQMNPGETWPVSVWVKLPLGTTAKIIGAPCPLPYSTGAGPMSTASAPVVTADGNWQQIAGTWTNTSSGLAWPLIGLECTTPSPRTWADQGTTTWADHLERWIDHQATFVDDISVTGPPVATRRVLIFAGQVTDVVVSPVTDTVIQLEVTAADIGAALENDAIGDDPWPVQALQTRASTITSLAHLNVPVIVDQGLQAIQVSYRDVDAQPVLALLQDLAQSVAATLWTATHGTAGSYFWMEDPDDRVSVQQLGLGVGTLPVLDATNPATNPNLEGGSLTGWSAVSATAYPLTLDASGAMSGTYSALTTRTDQSPSITAGALAASGVSVAYIPATAGDTVTVSIDVKTEQAARKIRGFLQFYDSVSVTSSSPTVTLVDSTAAGVVNRVTVSGVVPAGMNSVRLRLLVETLAGNAITGERVWFDRIRWGGADYFDGSTPASGDLTFNWTGAVNASTSERWKGHGGWIIITGSTRDVSVLSASDILRDPVQLSQTVAEIITTVSITWLEQTLDDDGVPAPTERVTTVIDEEAADTYGRRRLAITTDLISETDATDLGTTLLARSRRSGWRADSYTWDTGRVKDHLDTIDDGSRQVALMDLLDGGTRIGKALTLIDLPAWMPSDVIQSMYVEGGTYTFRDNAWVLELTISPAQGQGQSVAWQDIPADTSWEWQDWSPDLRWIDLYGVAGPTFTPGGI